MDSAKNRQSERKVREKELVAHYVSGDKKAFRGIIELYKNPLYAFLRRFFNRNDLIDEVFQETFLQLYRSRNTFDAAKPLRPWLFTIAANKARDLLRKQQREDTITIGTMTEPSESNIDDVVNSLISYEKTPYDEVETSERAENVREVIDRMPTNLKEILLLAYFEQFSYKQMAGILSIPIGTVKSRLHTAVVYFTKKWEALSSGDGNS